MLYHEVRHLLKRAFLAGDLYPPVHRLISETGVANVLELSGFGTPQECLSRDQMLLTILLPRVTFPLNDGTVVSLLVGGARLDLLG